jgi:hypothetical protein
MTNKQSNGPVNAHPTTVAEIQDVEREIAALDLQLMDEARELYEALRKGGAPAAPLRADPESC